MNGGGEFILGPFAPVAQRGMADVHLGGDLGHGYFLQAAGADQGGLLAGEDPAAHGGGQDQVRVPAGRLGVGDGLVVFEAVAAGGVAGLGAGAGPPGPPRRPGQPGRQRHVIEPVQVQGAQRRQEPGEDLGLQVGGVAGVGGGQPGGGAAQAGQRDPGQGHGPLRAAEAGAAHELGPHPVAGPGAGRRVQEHRPELVDGHGPVGQARREAAEGEGQRGGPGGQQRERALARVQDAGTGGQGRDRSSHGKRSGRSGT